ncbi:UNVERIFIED_CONTAM: hypothetical protein Sangu_1041600 [Sesamum angustifolium]|uniref:Reverse transcriptase RNase H-like domain-containing protein n=1 Tax=Sesamum angustifolium TaxID=2727405 RepID=A0AAW2NXY9_9LAMI
MCIRSLNGILGFMVIGKGIEEYLLKINAVLDMMKAPMSIHEVQHTSLENMVFALEVISRRLHPYFLSHPAEVKTNPSLKQTLAKPHMSSRLVKWVIELSEYEISYLSLTTIKAQALIDFVSKMANTSPSTSTNEEVWLLHVDGSTTFQGSGAKIVITSPQGEDMEFVVRLNFKASNNNVEYEALEKGTRIPHKVGAKHLITYSDIQLIVKQIEGV